MKKVISLILATAMVLSLAACSQSTTTAPAAETQAAATEAAKAAETQAAETQAAITDEPVTLKIWATNVMISTKENKLPEEEWYLTGAMARYKELHPNVEFEVTNYGTDNNTLANDFKAATLAQNGPDVLSPVSGPTMLSFSEGLLPLNDYLDDSYLNNILGWNVCSEDMDETKNIYGIPYSGQNICGFAYNKTLIKNAGLDFENNPPRTLEEFYAALDAIKATGVTPICADEGTDPLLALYDLVLWWEQKTGLQGLVDHTFGDSKYVDDEGFIFFLNEYKKFYENGWVNEDVSTCAESEARFLNGDCALKAFGSGSVLNFREALGDDLGVIAIPSAIPEDVDKNTSVGGVGACLAVSKFSKNQEVAVDFIKFLTSKDEFIKYYSTKGSIPVRSDITAEELNRTDPLYPFLNEMAKDVYYWPDNCMSQDAANVFYAQLNQVLVGKLAPEELARMLDEAQED